MAKSRPRAAGEEALDPYSEQEVSLQPGVPSFELLYVCTGEETGLKIVRTHSARESAETIGS